MFNNDINDSRDITEDEYNLMTNVVRDNLDYEDVIDENNVISLPLETFTNNILNGIHK